MTRRAAGTCVTIKFCIVTGGEGRAATTRRASDDTTGHACDMAERKATIRSGEACDTAPGAPRHGAQRAQPGRSGRAAGFRVCTQPSLDSGHGFESLFGGTVHEVLKIKNNKKIIFFK